LTDQTTNDYMSQTSSLTDLDLMTAVKADDQKAYRVLFNRYYKYLLVTAYNYVPDQNLVRDFAQDVFLEIWKKRKTLNISNVKAYLRRAVINKSLNHIKAQRLDFEEDQSNLDSTQQESAQADLEYIELQEAVNQAIESLPERCRAVFALRRFEELSLKEIAAQLDISPKTVENQLTKAMKIMRKAVEKFKASTE